MIGRVILAALLAGIAAGFIMAAIQHVRLTPLIMKAETFETASHGHDASEPAGSTEAQDHDDGWMPADGWQRTMATTLASLITGAGFAGILAGISLLTGLAINRRNGVIWGLAGFIAATLAPAAGLPPELPGMPVADLAPRQIWWVGTAAATGLAIWLIAVHPAKWSVPAAVLLVALPHVVGAPIAASHDTAVPAGLASAFASNAIAAGAVFWVFIGLFLGIAIEKLVKEPHAA